MGEAAGNATKAAICAGYAKGSAHVTASRLLRNAKVAGEIANLQANDPKIADRAERQQFWTWAMRSETVRWRDRLKASELLGKSGADFIEKHEHSGELRVTLADLLTGRDR